MSPIEIIDKYGNALAEKLGLAFNQLYAIMVWYIRVDQAVSMTEKVVFIATFILSILIAHRFLQPVYELAEEADDYSDWDIGIILIWCGVVCAAICLAFMVQSFIFNIAAIIWPEYGIIHNILQLAGKK